MWGDIGFSLNDDDQSFIWMPAFFGNTRGSVYERKNLDSITAAHLEIMMKLIRSISPCLIRKREDGHTSVWNRRQTHGCNRSRGSTSCHNFKEYLLKPVAHVGGTRTSDAFTAQNNIVHLNTKYKG